MSLPSAQSQRTAFSSPRSLSVSTPRRDPRVAPFVLALTVVSKREPGAGVVVGDTSAGSALTAFAVRLMAKRILPIA